MTILVVALYSNTTSKNAKHTAIIGSFTIGAISNLGMQLFKHRVTYSWSDVAFPDKAIWLLWPMSFLTSMSSPLVSHSDVQALSWVPLIISTAIKSHQIHERDKALCEDDHPHLFYLVAYYFYLHIMAASTVVNYYSITGEQNLNFWGFFLG